MVRTLPSSIGLQAGRSGNYRACRRTGPSEGGNHRRPLYAYGSGRQRATSTIPIVFAVVADPVGAGLIANLARPGGNITGLTSGSAELGGKRLELLKQVVQKASRVAVLYNPADPSNVLVLKELKESAPTLGLILQPLEVREPGEFESAFLAMTQERTHAMFGATGRSDQRAQTGPGGPRRQASDTGDMGRIASSSTLAASCHTP